MTSFLEDRRDEILALAALHGGRNVRVLRSHARGEAATDRDVDFLVDLDDGRTLLDHVGLCQDLEELLACHVDVVLTRSISPYLEERILAEAVPL